MKNKDEKSSKNLDGSNIRITGKLKIKNKNVIKGKSTNSKLNKYWRQVQREQLGASANIYMIFASAILGFLIHFLIEKKENLGCVIFINISIAITFLIFSLGFYGWFTHNRLRDFRRTAKYYKSGKTEEQVSELTKEIGEFTWKLYDLQRALLFLGFIFSLIGLGIFIFA